jgi:hypothetical protein
VALQSVGQLPERRQARIVGLEPVVLGQVRQVTLEILGQIILELTPTPLAEV